MKTIIFLSLGVLLFLNFSGCSEQPTNIVVEELNKKMETTIRLTPAQIQSIQDLNYKYWQTRQSILNDPNQVGKFTAVLACWDNWLESLKTKLDEGQFNQLLAWQNSVDILSDQPF